ncbi:hypothetical protein [Flavobacterium aquatile]|uniref:Uncharacterized protein n=1 Tax=Flavobacterium aquatile LMG 4008 = ATCC 11947 TaxID=1453498 RepID=A0A095SQD4_9FLAO|nr:hypothetical protein [Flavobacterium aquatile]KGD66881.1 hypothetical protein LG45_15745 [Flavobacterium aquatile LMG 4008 = ATCC 11947]OXA67974.1 hypothetical protein B0A61_05765 [Flavobacterium aquatile LMG 4008 = ATCC 11947]GEC80049.1 hypothetical protein FAQ01_29190 [Flavobacterium aquatile]
MNQITKFWNHFKENNFVFLLLNEIPKDEIKVHFDKLIYLLHQYNKNLDLIIKNKNKDAELIITANGNPYLFKEVELLVHHSIALERWKITAFLQPEHNITKYKNCTDKPFEYYGINLKISEMYFIPIKNSKKETDIGIKVFIKNYIIHKYNPRLREAVYMHIEHLIGEKAFANDIAFIEIGQLVGNQEKLIELYNLKFYIDC